MDLKERGTLLRIAPHLVRPLPFILPFYDASFLTRTKIEIGLSLYDWFAGGANLEKHRTLKMDEIAVLEPYVRMEDLSGGALFWDAQVDLPERLCMANILDAETAGATVFNYCRVRGAITENGRIVGVIAKDAGRPVAVRARMIVNASGPWFDRVAGLLQKGERQKIRTTKGVHIACPPTISKHAVVFDSHIDGRTMFVIPWLGFTWVGTTDTDFAGDPNEAYATREDVRYLVESAAAVVPALKDTEIYFSTAGVRALVRAGGSESSVSRKHRFETMPGLVSVLGGKITGYRAIAEEVTDILADKLTIKTGCQTANLTLPATPDMELEKQILYSVEKEHCHTLNDFVFRRTSLGFAPDQGRSQLERIADKLADALNWSNEERNAQLKEYSSVVERANAFRQRLSVP
jgi:glycerol-3-phosphate dehydrogenase